MDASLNGPLGRTALGQNSLRIGRAPDNMLVITDPQASSHHAEVSPGFGGNSYQVTDLNSTNGTFVNDQRLAPNSPYSLNSGDVIRIGSTRFTYEMSAAGYAPTMAAGTPNYEQTIAANISAQPAYQPPPVFQQPAAYGNAGAPPPSYPQHQPGYPQAQPAYPQPGGFGQPGYPPRKRSRVGLWLGLIVVLLLLVGGGIGGYLYLQNRSTPEKTLQAYCTALEHSDAQGVYNTFSSASQAKTSPSKLGTAMQAITLLFGGIKDCTYTNVQQNGSLATATLTLTPDRGRVFSGTSHLVDENNQWKIDNNALPTS